MGKRAKKTRRKEDRVAVDLNLGRSLHRKAALHAAALGVSLEEFILKAICDCDRG